MPVVDEWPFLTFQLPAGFLGKSARSVEFYGYERQVILHFPDKAPGEGRDIPLMFS